MTFYVQNENDKDFEDNVEMTLLILWGSYLQFLSPQTSPNIPFNLFSMALSAIFSHSIIFSISFHDRTLRFIFFSHIQNLFKWHSQPYFQISSWNKTSLGHFYFASISSLKVIITLLQFNLSLFYDSILILSPSTI